MDIAECYRLLELTSRANLDDLKASYRRLARQWHPDVNPGNQQAQDLFIKATEAYQVLQKIVPAATLQPATPKPAPPNYPTTPSRVPPKVQVSVRSTAAAPSPPPQPTPGTAAPAPQPKPSSPQASRPQEPSQAPPSTLNTPAAEPPPLSKADLTLKLNSYEQLQGLIQSQRFPRAIALVEALAQHLPQDPEVRQWQGIIYRSWGRQLIKERKLEQARAYLKKALKTDPHNKALWAEIDKDFRQLERIFRTRR
ncbi:MAG: DnaJ domain-containing protein [Acaryochloridaceae cyanobacterium SU_2_1]|nr:DnaJ domain-containing protein [Acaryochloridaceae cyanobacterium SU_2_1]